MKPARSANRFGIGLAELREESARHWTLGRPLRRLPATPLRLAIERPADSVPVDFQYAGLPIFSDALLKAFLAEGVDNLETSPAVLCEASGREWDGFFAVNIIGVVACADLAKSEFNDFQQKQQHTVSFESLVLDPSKTRDLLCFRLAEDLSSVIVHRRIAARLAERALTGIRFESLDSEHA